MTDHSRTTDSSDRVQRGADSLPHERRLAEKVKAAMNHAFGQGRGAIAERLRLCYDAICEEDAEYEEDRRKRRD